MKKHPTVPFREHHLFALLKQFEKEKAPLDFSIHRYFRTHRSLGSKDRGEIAETIYGMIRWKGLLDALSYPPFTWEKRLQLFKTLPITTLDSDKTFETNSLPPHTALSFPKELYTLLVKDYGKDLAKKLCWASNYPAPTTVRINRLKTTREAMLKRWEKYPISPCPYAENGIFFHKKYNFFEFPEFKEGLFEIQDEGSQMLADLVKVKPGEQVLDFCAGSGGKTLAFAYRLQGKGQIYLHDIRPSILQEARKRLKRAGIQNAQVIPPEGGHLKKLKKRMEWVLVDVPCSGTGTLRRNPDMKWKFNEEMLIRLTAEQRIIFEKALSFVKPEGYIVYTTCSLLNRENQDQVTHFLNTYPIELIEKPFQSLPLKEGINERAMDGFFGAVFKKHGL